MPDVCPLHGLKADDKDTGELMPFAGAGTRDIDSDQGLRTFGVSGRTKFSMCVYIMRLGLELFAHRSS